MPRWTFWPSLSGSSICPWTVSSASTGTALWSWDPRSCSGAWGLKNQRGSGKLIPGHSPGEIRPRRGEIRTKSNHNPMYMPFLKNRSYSREKNAGIEQDFRGIKPHDIWTISHECKWEFVFPFSSLLFSEGGVVFRTMDVDSEIPLWKHQFVSFWVQCSFGFEHPVLGTKLVGARLPIYYPCINRRTST